MRVLWVIDSLGPGGAENLMVPLLTNLKNHVDNPRVCVLSIREGNPITEELKKIGIPVDLIPVRNLRSFTGIWRLFNYIRQYRPDIIHTQLEHSDILGTLSAKLLGIPSISTMHTLDLQSRKIKKYLRNSLRWGCLNYIASRIIFVSEFTRQHYIRLGFRISKLVTIYNGIDTDNFVHQEKSDFHQGELFGIPKDSVVITTVAVLRELKGIQYMLHAMVGLLEKIPNLYYVIVGDGEHREFLENLSKSLDITDHVVFMGRRTDIPKILAASDLFVYPTLKDALPTALLEAMATGVPIVASEVDGVPEILENNVTGLLVPQANPTLLVEACLRLLWDHELASRLSAAAYQTIQERFDIRRQALCILSIYKKLVAEHEH
jgi:glycosyltransferase involved in cell wall biosynthesis